MNVAYRSLLSLVVCVLALFLSSCEVLDLNAEALSRNMRVELIDWHVSGLWVINSPVAWLRVYNYNNVPVHDITVEYSTFDREGKLLNKGNFTIEGTVPALQSKNFVELYLGIVDLYSDRLSVRLVSAKPASGH